ncbi:MAG: hypothetical protein Q9187_002861 [Circinaria calcarea]
MMRLLRSLQIEKLELIIQNGHAVPETHSIVPRKIPKLLPYPKTFTKIFPFLELPAEIRVRIYRFMLLEEHVRNSEPNPRYELSPLESEPFSEPNPDYELSSWESEPFAGRFFNDIPHTQNIRCQNNTLDTFHMQTNILLVNRQIYSEAISIFSKNEWIRIETDLNELSTNLKDNGYAIVCDSIPFSQSVSYPVLTDVFMVTRTDLKLLLRAVSTIRDLDEVALDIKLLATAAVAPILEAEALSPFFPIRGFGAVRVQGLCHEKRLITDLPARMMHQWSFYYILAESKSLIARGTEAYLASDWAGASEVLEALLTLFCDFQRSSPELASDMSIGPRLKFATRQMAIYLGGAKCMLDDFQSAIKYTTYAMSLCPMPLDIRALALLWRGRAYLRSRRYQKSARDLLDASYLMPENQELQHSLTHLEQALDNDPKKAQDAFVAMVITIQQEKKDEKKAQEKRLAELIAARG